MRSPKLSLEQQRELVANWQETGHLLAVQRRSELAAQSPAESRQSAFDMLQLGGLLPRDIARESSSGLVEMQRHFARWYSRGRA